MKSLQITVELLDGNPHGVRRSKIQHRQARAIAIPRGQLSRMGEFEEFNKPGIYFLLGSVPAGPTIYVGQTDKLSDRLRQHGRERQDWKEFVAITSSDDWMNIAHARCLESRCWSNCQENRYFVLNQQGPKEPQVSEQDRGFLEEFFEHMICLTRSLGYDFLSQTDPKKVELDSVVRQQQPKQKQDRRSKEIPESYRSAASKTIQSPSAKARFERVPDTQPLLLCSRCQNTEAILHCYPGLYLLKAGSHLRELRPSSHHQVKSLVAQRERALNDGTISRAPDGYLLKRDLTFKSPSSASSFVLGGASNGWIDWKDESGQQLQVHRLLLDKA